MTPTMNLSLVTVVVTFICAYLVVTEVFFRRREERGVVKYRWTYPLEVGGSFVTVALTVLSLRAAPLPPSVDSVLFGSTIFLLGAWFRMRAKADLGRYWSQQIEIRPGQQLIDRGIYRRLRHPGYLGLMMEIAAIPIVAGSVPGMLAVASLLIPAVLLRVRLEERVLTAHLPSYGPYRRSTPAFLPVGPVVRRTTPEQRVRRIRTLFALLGFVVAAAGLALVEPGHWRTYVVFGVLVMISHFFWFDLPPPIPSMVLPYLTTITAFIYIGGLPIIGIDYVARLLTFPIMLLLSRRGIISPPGYVRPMVEAFESRGSFFTYAHIDSWANHAQGATSLVARYLTFRILTGAPFGLHPVVAVAGGEFVGYAYQAIVNMLLPLPTSEWLREMRMRSWPKPVALDSRLDVMIAINLSQPPLLFLIYYGYLTHGLGGAAVWSAATLGPHFLLRALNDRRKALAAQHEELQTASERLRDMNCALEEKARALERKQDELKAFVYTVTHDLKNPLAAIILIADLIREREGPLLTHEGREDLDRLVHLAGGTEDMIRDLLNLFQITSAPEAPTVVDLQALVAQALDTLRPQTLAKGVHVWVGALPSVWGQRRKLGHAVTNLLSNAVKYVPAGRGEVTVRGEVRDGSVRLCVRDNGIGIPAAYHGNIFELFGRVPPSEQVVDGHSVEGTGVGLAIVKRSVEASGGSVWVESEAGKGSRFYLELPLAGIERAA